MATTFPCCKNELKRRSRRRHSPRSGKTQYQRLHNVQQNWQSRKLQRGGLPGRGIGWLHHCHGATISSLGPSSG
eukprot:5578724-Prymnesium_polylepis.2